MNSQTTFGMIDAERAGEGASSNLSRRKAKAAIAQGALLVATAFAILVLAALLWDIGSAGAR